MFFLRYVIFLILFFQGSVIQNAFASDASTDFEWSMISWNVDQATRLGNFCESRRREKATIEILKEQNYDLIILQAVYRKNIQNRILKELAVQYPYRIAMTDKTSKHKKFTPGFVVASKFPLKSVSFKPYVNLFGEDACYSKGAFLFEVKLAEDKTIQVLTTHLQNGKDEAHQRVREHQLHLMSQMLDENKRPEVAQLIVGDLVIDSYDTKNYQKLISLLGGLDDFLQGDLRFSVGGVENTRTCARGGHPKLSDYVLLRNNADAIIHVESKQLVRFTSRTRRKNKLFDLSNHYPIVSRIQWN
ncbi:MAG: hypothetical protein QE271_12535 [Bacteriovoracaceae bacterium]|nr:hypothetical protein [Bacteriovoracaceae bacterium]